MSENSLRQHPTWSSIVVTCMKYCFSLQVVWQSNVVATLWETICQQASTTAHCHCHTPWWSRQLPILKQCNILQPTRNKKEFINIEILVARWKSCILKYSRVWNLFMKVSLRDRTIITMLPSLHDTQWWCSPENTMLGSRPKSFSGDLLHDEEWNKIFK